MTLMTIEKLSEQYEVRRLTEADMPDLLALAQGNPTYYEPMHTQPTLANLTRDLTALPPGKALEDKYFLGYYQDGHLAAVLDLITAYPNPETAFIGWFILRKDLQGRGLGTAIIHELMFRLPYRYIRLCYVKGNRESERFWKKLHFAPTGVEAEGDGYTMVVMQLGRSDTHTFGIMEEPPEPGRRYDDYEPERYICAWAEDDILSGVPLSGIDTYFHTLDCPGKGLAWCGITLIPPAALPAVSALVDSKPELQELAKLLERAETENKFVIHFGI